MATAFDYYKPTGSQTTANPALNSQISDLESRKRLADQELQRSRQFVPGGFAGMRQAPVDTSAVQRSNELNNQLGTLRNQASGASSSGGSPAASRDQALGMTAGVSDRIMNDAQIASALGQLESGMKSGPYSEAMQQQLVNRNADQSAAMEATNADQIRNEAAARGIDPSAALRQGQSQRQQSNIAFQGDLGSKAAVTNYEAQQNAARSLASGRLSQYGQAQPGYGQAANYLANEQFTSPRVGAVQSNSAPQIAFSGNRGGSSIPNPNLGGGSLPSYGGYTQTNFGGDPTNNQNKKNGPSAPLAYKPGNTAFSYKPPTGDGYSATGASKLGATQNFGY